MRCFVLLCAPLLACVAKADPFDCNQDVCKLGAINITGSSPAGFQLESSADGLALVAASSAPNSGGAFSLTMTVPYGWEINAQNMVVHVSMDTSGLAPDNAIGVAGISLAFNEHGKSAIVDIDDGNSGPLSSYREATPGQLTLSSFYEYGSTPAVESSIGPAVKVQIDESTIMDPVNVRDVDFDFQGGLPTATAPEPSALALLAAVVSFCALAARRKDRRFGLKRFPIG